MVAELQCNTLRLSPQARLVFMGQPDLSNYDPASREQLTNMLTAVYDTLLECEDEPEIVRYFAGCCFLTAIMGKACGLNVCDLEQSLDPKLDRKSQIQKYISVYLDLVIEGHLKFVAQWPSSPASSENEQYNFRTSILNTALLWKGFLLTDNQHGGELEKLSSLSMRCFRILSTVAGKDAVDWIKNLRARELTPTEKELLATVQSHDWPPPSFLARYFQRSVSAPGQSNGGSQSNLFEHPPEIHEPGVMSPGQSLLSLVRPQLFAIKDKFFDGRAGRSEAAFAKFIRFSVIAGYTLGIGSAGIAARNEKLTEYDVLNFVMNVHASLSMNHADIDVCGHFYWQDSTFKFGLDLGSTDYSRYMAEQARVGKSQYVLLTALCDLLLKYPNEETLTENLEIFCQVHGVRVRYPMILSEVAEHWELVHSDLLRG
jgi:hypothetical protein